MILRVGAWNKIFKRQQIDPSNPFMQQLRDKDKVMNFDCERFSCFAEEKETLFFGGETVLRIKGIIGWSQGQWMRYDKYLEAINVFSRMMDGFSVMDQPIVRRKKDQKMMKRIIRDILRSLIWKLQEAETPKYVHELMLFHHSAASRVQLLYDELLAEYKWMHCILKSPYTDTLDITNIALLFCHSERITFLMADSYELSDEECLTLMEGVKSMVKLGLETTVRFKWPSEAPQSSKYKMLNLGIGFLDHLSVQFRAQSVSITIDGVIFEYQTQRRYESRARHLIDCLSKVQVQAELNSVGAGKQLSYEVVFYSLHFSKCVRVTFGEYTLTYTMIIS